MINLLTEFRSESCKHSKEPTVRAQALLRRALFTISAGGFFAGSALLTFATVLTQAFKLIDQVHRGFQPCQPCSFGFYKLSSISPRSSPELSTSFTWFIWTFIPIHLVYPSGLPNRFSCAASNRRKAALHYPVDVVLCIAHVAFYS